MGVKTMNTELELLREQNKILRTALERIKCWEMPECDSKYESGNPMSFAVAYGSQGQEKVIRNIAKEALSTTVVIKLVVDEEAIHAKKIIKFIRNLGISPEWNQIANLIEKEFIQ